MAKNSSAPHPQCYPPMPAVSNGILQGDLPFDFALPLLTMQIAIVLLVTRTVAALFKPIKQPRVLAEIIGGVLLGPTALGRNKFYMETLFPLKSIPLLETVATIGLMFFIFMVGLELDLQALRKTGKKALLIAAMGILVPFVASIGLAGLIRSTIAKGAHMGPLLIFMGAPISISAFSVLVRIMAELKLLSTDLAKLAIPIAAVNDVTIWTLLAVGVAIAGGSKKSTLTPVWVILCAIGFGIFMFTVMRKVMGVIARRATREEGESTDVYVCATLMGVLAAGFCSDAVGVHALLGPFLLGLVLPKDNAFPKMITEKIEDFVTGLFLPLFFASSGLKTNLGTLHGVYSLGFLVLFFCTASGGKIMGSFLTARLLGLPNRRALILGFLLNTKGLAVLIVLNIGRDLKALTDELFAILVLTALLTSFVTTPVVTALCRPGLLGSEEGQGATGGGGGGGGGGSSSNSSRRRNPQRRDHRSLAALINNELAAKKGPQLRILGCSYNDPRHLHASFINLLEASRGLKQSPLKVYPLNLSLLSERPSAIFMLAPASPLPLPLPLPLLSFPPSPSLSKVVVRPLSSCISHLDSMHADICQLAAQKRAALILLPYQTPAAHITPSTVFSEPSSFHKVTQKVLDQAPCSVGILVDTRAGSDPLGGVSPIHPSYFSYKVVVLFVGGPDDREALFLGSRMIDHPGVALKIVRYFMSSEQQHNTSHPKSSIAASHHVHMSLQAANNNNIYSFEEVDEQDNIAPTPDHDVDDDHEPGLEAGFDQVAKLERHLDDEAIAKVKERASESSFVYEEEHIAQYGQLGLVEAVKAFTLKEMREVNMCIVGRGRLRPKLNASISEQQLSELGVIGDALASASSGLEFHACILVIQQHHEYSSNNNNEDTSHKKVVDKTLSFTRSQSPTSFEIMAAV